MAWWVKHFHLDSYFCSPFSWRLCEGGIVFRSSRKNTTQSKEWESPVHHRREMNHRRSTSSDSFEYPDHRFNQNGGQISVTQLRFPHLKPRCNPKKPTILQIGFQTWCWCRKRILWNAVMSDSEVTQKDFWEKMVPVCCRSKRLRSGQWVQDGHSHGHCEERKKA